MTALSAFVRRHPLACFFGSAFAISWGGILLVVGGPAGFTGDTARTDPRFPIVYLAMLAGPSVSGLLLTWSVDGPAGLRRLGSRLMRWRASPWTYALAALTAPIVVSTSVFVLSLSGSRLTLDTVMFGLVVGLGAGIFEELGWTGFATIHLRERYGTLGTGVILGVIWAAWHVLAVVWGIGTTAGSVPLALFVAADLLSVLPVYRVLMVRIHDHTHSLALAMLTHASLTSTLLILGPSGATGADLLIFDAMVAATLWIVVAVLIAGRQRSGSPIRASRRPAHS